MKFADRRAIGTIAEGGLKFLPRKTANEGRLNDCNKKPGG